MRPLQIILISFLGGLAFYFEFRNIREWSIFGGAFFDDVPFYALCILTVVYLVKNTRQYQRDGNIRSYVPSLIGFLFFSLLIGHKLLLSQYDSSPTIFTATNYDLGSDGGFTLEFKANNHLKGEKIDRFSTTRYWGTYRQQADTLVLKVFLDFKMGRQAVLQDSILRFIDDTVIFYVSRY